MSNETLKLALEALEKYCTPYQDGTHPADEAITAIKQALAAPTVQEPVAFALRHKNGLEFNSNYPMVKTLEEAEDLKRRHFGEVKIAALYTTPPAAQRQWFGLTKTMVGNHLRRHALGDQPTFRQGFKEGVAFAELKLKEKK